MTQNNTALSIKNAILQTMRHEKQTQSCQSVDICDRMEYQHYPVTYEILKALLPSGFPQSSMKLKVDMPVMLLHNINNVSEGLCNRSSLIVTRLHQNWIGECIIGATFNSRDHVIFRIKLSINKSELP